jgi:hypothetical protein
VGAVTFHVGVSSKLVIEAAQRQYLRSQTPEEVQHRLLKRQYFLEAINEGIGDESEQFRTGIDKIGFRVKRFLLCQVFL